MATPSPVFPAGVATDADLKVANNLIRTSLAVGVNAANTILFVASTAGFVPNCLVSIDNEIVSISSVVASPNPQLVVAGSGRGFDGTLAAAHAAGAKVSMFIDAWHHNALAVEIKAIESFIGAGGQNIGTGYPFLVSASFQFAPQSPGGSLAPGNNVITLSPVPKGVNGSDTGHYLYISGGTGAAEAVPITGGTAVSGAASGTLIVNCANAHSGAWTIASATGGIQEAVNYATDGAKILISADITLYANVVSNGKSVIVEKFPGVVIGNAVTYRIFSCKNNYGITANNELIATNAVSIAGMCSSDTEPIGGPPSPSTLYVYRSTTNNEDPNQGQNAMYVQEDFRGTQGTAGAIRANLFVPNCITSNGPSAISGYCFLGWTGVGSGTIGFGVHGQTDVYNGIAGHQNVGIGLNAEGSAQQAGAAGPMPILTGVVSNMGTTNVIDAHMTGVDVHSNPNPGGVNSGGGVEVHADGSGTHQFGLKINDNGGQYLQPVLINTSQANSPAVNICNTNSSLGAASSSINFFRGDLLAAHQLAGITVANTTDYGNGVLKIATANGSTLVTALTVDQSQVVTVAKSVKTTPIPVSQLPPSAGAIGSWACVNDATSTTIGAGVTGGGANTVGVFCSFTGWKIVVS